MPGFGVALNAAVGAWLPILSAWVSVSVPNRLSVTRSLTSMFCTVV